MASATETASSVAREPAVSRTSAPSTSDYRGQGRGNARSGTIASTNNSGSRREWRGRGRGRGKIHSDGPGRRANQQPNASYQPTPPLNHPLGPNGEANSNATQSNGTGTGKNNTTNSALEENEADVENEICFICASPVVHHAVAPCNHRTCHICALRLRALYKTRACAHCRVGGSCHCILRWRLTTK